jgi:hypothetical protein
VAWAGLIVGVVTIVSVIALIAMAILLLFSYTSE